MTLFYDGHCGLCHRSVRFVIQHDREQVFHFAPLQGETASKQLPRDLPDSMVLLTAEGVLLLRSDAWVYILRRLGGTWNVVAGAMALIPRPLRDLGYRTVALIRSVFARPTEACPLVPAESRNRFYQ